MLTFDNEKDAQKAIDFAKFKVEQSKQNKHILGTNENKISVINKENKSLISNSVDSQKLVNQYAGKGQQIGNTPIGQPGSKERITTNKVIGTFYDANLKKQVPTSNFIIHYSKKGVHLVPSKP